VRRIKAGDNRASPFWNSFKNRVGVVDLPKVPLDPKLDGFQLVEWGAYDHYSKFSSTPGDLAEKILQRFGRHPFLDHNFEVALHKRRDFDALKAQFSEGIRMKQRLNLALMKELRPRLFFGVFGETHAAGHALWRFQDPRHPSYEADGPHRDALRDIYRELDRAIGAFMEALPRDYVFMLLSSHGFCMDSMAGEAFLCEVLVKAGVSVPRLEKITYAPYAPAMTFDMKRSRAFALPTDLQGYIRINLRGREPNGIVPESEYDSVCEELKAELLALCHGDNGAPVVKEVIRIRDTFQGPFIEELPDLSVIWNTDYVVTNVVSPRCGLIRRDPDLSAGGGNHRGGGFILVSGSGVTRRRFAGHEFDIAPTVANLLGERGRPEWDGHALQIRGRETPADD
jgi:predicted AlkP superfamily phosphohydrolase/phosphomutase